MTRSSRSTEILEIHISFPLHLQGIPLPTLSHASKIPIPSPKTVYLPGDRVAVQGPGIGILPPKNSKHWLSRYAYNSGEQREENQREKKKEKKRMNMGNKLKKRELCSLWQHI